MRLSEKKSNELYDAMSDEIMKERVKVRMNDKSLSAEQVDEMLYMLEHKIWPRIKKALNLNP